MKQDTKQEAKYDDVFDLARCGVLFAQDDAGGFSLPEDAAKILLLPSGTFLCAKDTFYFDGTCGGKVPEATTQDEFDKDLSETALAVAPKVEAHMEKFQFNLALEDIWVLVRRANKYIDEKMPWALAKDESKKAELDTCMHELAEAIRIISVLILPFMHSTSEKMRDQLGIGDKKAIWEDAFVFDQLNGEEVHRGDVLFPRLDVEKELKELDELKKKQMEEAGIVENKPLELKPEIEFDDFDKIDLRVGKIVKAEKHPKADRLLVFQVKMGTETRQVISGVSEYFKPEEMVGKKVIVVANLKPRALRGMESKGMLLFADNGERIEIVTTDAEDGNSVN